MRTTTYIFLLLLAVVSAFAPLPQGDPAESLLAQMAPEERVGQLFLLTFDGSRLDTDDPILNLIRDNHISGVVLRSGNDNFSGPENTLRLVKELITSLQSTEYQASLPQTGAEVEVESRAYIPLLIGVIQEGNGPEYSEIMSGLSPMPSQMALGATWSPELSRAAGAVLGMELSAMGFNMLLGPSLDV